jgi:alpha-amylase
VHMGVLLQAFYQRGTRGVPCPLDGDPGAPFWWDHLAAQAHALRKSGFTAVWLPPPLKGGSGVFSVGYDVFDDYDLGSKDQRGHVATRYGTREQLARCVAMMRANEIDVYVDLVENQRDGDGPGEAIFRYADADGHVGDPRHDGKGGRFPKVPGCFHFVKGGVPEDPNVFDDRFRFGRDLAPVNGKPPGYVSKGLMDSADWLTRALDLQGFRIDDVKGTSTDFLFPLLNHGALAGNFAVGEFADENLALVRNWLFNPNGMRGRSSAFDFPLRGMLKQICNGAGFFEMALLDHAGLAGSAPLQAVTFVENHDTDRGGIGGPIVRNKPQGYAYILTSEGYPCVFYKDYSTDPGCFGLKPTIGQPHLDPRAPGGRPDPAALEGPRRVRLRAAGRPPPAGRPEQQRRRPAHDYRGHRVRAEHAPARLHRPRRRRPHRRPGPGHDHHPEKPGRVRLRLLLSGGFWRRLPGPQPPGHSGLRRRP